MYKEDKKKTQRMRNEGSYICYLCARYFNDYRKKIFIAIESFVKWTQLPISVDRTKVGRAKAGALGRASLPS